MQPDPVTAEKYNIKVLQRAFSILEAVLDAGRPLSLEEIRNKAQTPKSTTFRIITNLLHRGYMIETADGYWLGLKMLSFGSAVEAHLDLRQVASKHLRQLRHLTGETAYLATLSVDLGSVIYLDKVATEQPVGVTLHNIGMTLPMYCTALGKVLAAYRPVDEIQTWLQHNDLPRLTPTTITDPTAFTEELARIREQGYAVDDGERETTICCIAAPLFNHQTDIAGAISIAGPRNRMPYPLEASEIARRVVETAQRISAELGVAAVHPRGGEAN